MPRKNTPNNVAVQSRKEIVAANTAQLTEQVTNLLGSLVTGSMKKHNNNWYIAVPKTAEMTSRLVVVKLYNKGHGSIRIVETDYVGSDNENHYLTATKTVA